MFQPSDGINTTLDQVLAQRVFTGRPTMHLVGVGNYVKEDALTALADATGGEYVTIDHVGHLQGALESAAATLKGELPTCFRRPPCDHSEARITVRTHLDGEAIDVSREVALPACM